MKRSPQQARKAKADAEYRKARQQRLVQARGRCEFVMVENGPQCMRVATQTHHVKRRSHQVDHDVENLKALCAEHHVHIHNHVEWAKANGWIVTSWAKVGE